MLGIGYFLRRGRFGKDLVLPEAREVVRVFGRNSDGSGLSKVAVFPRSTRCRNLFFMNRKKSENAEMDVEVLRGYGFKFIRPIDNVKEKSLIPYIRVQMENVKRLRELSSFWPIWFVTRVLYPYSHLNLGADMCYQIAKEHAELKLWAGFGISNSYACWFSVTLLHVWMIIVRFRAIEDEKIRKLLTQRIIDTFFIDIERGIVRVFNVTNPIIVGKSNKKFLRFYYGSMAAYDESLVKGDTVLADAIYRNVYAMDVESFKMSDIEKLVVYIREQVFSLKSVSYNDLMDGNWSFSLPPT